MEPRLKVPLRWVLRQKTSTALQGSSNLGGASSSGGTTLGNALLKTIPSGAQMTAKDPGPRVAWLRRVGRRFLSLTRKLPLPEHRFATCTKTAMGLGPRILFEDEHCLALWKPAGQFTQGTWAPPGEQTLEQEVREHFNVADPASVYLGIVHRLDRPVSGVLLWARTVKAARRLSRQFERRKVEKEYWAIVEAKPEQAQVGRGDRQTERDRPSDDTWIDWLTPAGVSGVVRSVAPGTERARQAVTRFRREIMSGLSPGCQWLRLWPETGRTHQLRVQAAIRGLPIVGDGNYGASRPFPQGIALHARRLSLRHPIVGTPLEISHPYPQAGVTWGSYRWINRGKP